MRSVGSYSTLGREKEGNKVKDGVESKYQTSSEFNVGLKYVLIIYFTLNKKVSVIITIELQENPHYCTFFN